MHMGDGHLKQKHITIVGTGIIGVATAIWLQRAGHQVTLIEKGELEDAASYGNGAVLASCSVVPVNTPGILAQAPRMLWSPDQPLFVKWGYLPRMLGWLARYLSRATVEASTETAAAVNQLVKGSLYKHQELAAGTGAEKYIVPSEYLYVYDSKEHFKLDSFGWSLRKKHGVQWQEMEGDELNRFDSSLSRHLTFAARMQHHGYVTDSGAYLQALRQHCLENGATLIQGEFTECQFSGADLQSIVVSGEQVECDAVVIATGAWSKPLVAKLGLHVPLESERGYHLDLWHPSHMPKAPMMVAGSKFVITPQQDRIRLAGIVEFGGMQAEASDRAFALLRRSIRKAMPDLTWSHETQWLGHRPAPADSIPVIGQLPNHKDVYVGFGHHHIGLTSGPATGRILANLIDDVAPGVDMQPFAPNRFK